MAINNDQKDLAKKVLIGAGLVAGAGLAAYLLASPKARKKAQLKVKSWMHDMKKEVAERAKTIQEVSQQKYNEIVDEVKPKYKALKEVSAAELNAFADELKARWDHISKEVGAKAKRAGKGKKK